MNILIKTLTIINFKGIKSKTIDFSHITNIFGANASGKTTIFDAFLWMLFGKDSSDRKDFSVKPLDKSGNKTDRSENEVSAVINVDGSDITIRHIQKEKWTKKRGEAVTIFDGNEHLYFWNEVPVQAGEFQAKVNDLLNEKIFKLITNPLYFNSMSWQDQRSVLTEIAGEITDSFLVSKYPELQALLDSLDGKTMKELKAMVSVTKKKLKTQLEEIPGRIDEIIRSKPEAIDEKEVKAKIEELQAAYSDLEKQIEDKTEAFNRSNSDNNAAIQANNQEIHRLKLAKQDIEAKHRSAYNSEVNNSESGINEAKSRLQNLEGQLAVQKSQSTQLYNSHVAHLQRLSKDKEDIESRMVSLRKLFVSVNGRELNENDTHCSGCGRELEADKLVEVKEKFDKRKREELEGINIQGQGLKKDLENRDNEGVQAIEQYDTTSSAISASIDTLEASIEEARAKVDSFGNNTIVVQPLQDRLAADLEYQSLNSSIASLEAKTFEAPQVDLSDLRVKKASINADLDSYKRQLTVGDQIKRADDRIDELKQQETTWSQELADLEKKEFAADKYERAKSEELEARVNGLFKYAKFSLFYKLNDGREEPTCKSTYNGVPFSDLNNAGKILVGIDIINTLSSHYGVTAPVFLDNRESVSVIPDTPAQIVNLIVSAEDKELRVA